MIDYVGQIRLELLRIFLADVLQENVKQIADVRVARCFLIFVSYDSWIEIFDRLEALFSKIHSNNLIVCVLVYIFLFLLYWEWFKQIQHASFDFLFRNLSFVFVWRSVVDIRRLLWVSWEALTFV